MTSKFCFIFFLFIFQMGQKKAGPTQHEYYTMPSCVFAKKNRLLGLFYIEGTINNWERIFLLAKLHMHKIDDHNRNKTSKSNSSSSWPCESNDSTNNKIANMVAIQWSTSNWLRGWFVATTEEEKNTFGRLSITSEK